METQEILIQNTFIAISKKMHKYKNIMPCTAFQYDYLLLCSIYMYHDIH